MSPDCVHKQLKHRRFMKEHQVIIAQWLEQIAEDIGTALHLEEDGHCIIPCVDNLNCVIEVPAKCDVAAVFIYLPLTLLPDQSEARLLAFSKALRLNLFGLLTGGCHIALDTRSNHIVLSFSSLIEALTATSFKHILNDMLELAPSLRMQLQSVTDCSSLDTEIALQKNLHRQLIAQKNKKG